MILLHSAGNSYTQEFTSPCFHQRSLCFTFLYNYLKRGSTYFCKACFLLGFPHHNLSKRTISLNSFLTYLLQQQFLLSASTNTRVFSASCAPVVFIEIIPKFSIFLVNGLVSEIIFSIAFFDSKLQRDLQHTTLN